MNPIILNITVLPAALDAVTEAHLVIALAGEDDMSFDSKQGLTISLIARNRVQISHYYRKVDGSGG